MFEDLKQNLDNSYSPYSNFRVSSCLVTKDGKMLLWDPRYKRGESYVI